jgi:transketolase
VIDVKDMSVEKLKQKAIELRKTALTMIYEARSGHPGGSLSSADIVAALYFKEMNIDPKNPNWADRDRFILSKGHVCPIQYAALALRGFFPYETIHTLRKYGSILQGHPNMNKCPGIDISTGSLGQGLSVGVVIVGDGESQEGQIWEAVETAVKYKLDNLVVFVDDNGLQCDGACKDIMPNQDIKKKFNAFGFETRRINGHSMEEIVETLGHIREAKNGNPKCIVMDTVKGKGVSFMENIASWHGVAPNDEEYKQAMEELEGGLK